MKIMHDIFRDSLIKNSIYLMMTNFIGSVFAFIFWIIAARCYTPNDIGIASALISSVSVISTISSMGLHNALIFYLPRYKNADKIINSCIIVSIVSSIIFSLIFILGLKIWSPQFISILNGSYNILIFVVITVAMTVSDLVGAALTAGRRSSFQMIKDSIYHFIKMFPLILFIGFGSIGVLISICIGLVLSIIIGFILLSKIWKYSPKLTIDPIIKNMVGFSIGNYIAIVFYNLPILILPIIILNMISSKFAGYFYIVIMIASLLYGISQSISTSLLTESSDKDEFDNNIRKSIKFNLIILTPGLLLLIIFGKFILNIFGQSYSDNAFVTMIILVLASIPISFINIFNTVRNAQHRVGSIVKMNILVALITVVLSIPLIRIMNIDGAAISYLMANIVGALVVVSRTSEPRKFTLKLLGDIKSNISCCSLFS
jgi:O-antigen/teichoic acid export membrane protein